MAMKFVRTKRAFFITGEESGFAYHISPSPPFTEDEVAFLEKLLKLNYDYLSDCKEDKSGSWQYMFQFLWQLEPERQKSESEEDSNNVVDLTQEEDNKIPNLSDDEGCQNHAFKKVRDVMGMDWNPRNMRKTWISYEANGGVLDESDALEISNMTRDEHVVIYNVLSWC
jgi:hypothetical protein